MDGRLTCWEKKELEWKKSWIFNLLAMEALKSQSQGSLAQS
jgi:hypothetical protein